MHGGRMASARNRVGDMGTGKTLSHKKAAEFLGISPGTLYNWVDARKITRIKMGRLNVYKESELIRFMEERTIDADPQV